MRSLIWPGLCGISFTSGAEVATFTCNMCKNQLAVPKFEGREVFACSCGGVFTSNDRGVNGNHYDPAVPDKIKDAVTPPEKYFKGTSAPQSRQGDVT